MQRTEEKGYYHIRKSLFWAILLICIVLIGLAYYRTELYEKWLKSRGHEEIVFENIESKLEDAKNCYLCGSDALSIKEHYKNYETIGLISLNDWYVLDIKLKNYDRNGVEISNAVGVGMNFGNTGEITYHSSGMPNRGRASMDITLPERYDIKLDLIQEHLCQTCLDKVTASLEYRKWRNERKNPIPLCLVDFQTLEIYSLQDSHKGWTVRDYWVEIEYNENKVEIDAFYLQEQYINFQ